VNDTSSVEPLISYYLISLGSVAVISYV
jgi:hypothetical protein